MLNSFSAWKIGVYYYGAGLGLALLFLCLALRGYRLAWIGVVVFGVFGLFSLYFFRDPERVITAREPEAVSPADGKILAVDDLQETSHYPGPCKRITIFLNVFNVHVNRAPFDGTVRDVKRGGSSYLVASKQEASENNVWADILMDTPRGPMTVRQITGMIARRIVCRTKQGDKLAKGQKFGMIQFGSRTELFLPMNAEILVKKGDKVNAGITVVAKFS
jgi:phosphatidylserine decarboxylase